MPYWVSQKIKQSTLFSARIKTQLLNLSYQELNFIVFFATARESCCRTSAAFPSSLLISPSSFIGGRTLPTASVSMENQWEFQVLAEAYVIQKSLARNRACAVVQEFNGGESILIRCAAAVRRGSSCPFFYRVIRIGQPAIWRVNDEYCYHTCPESERVQEEMEFLEDFLKGLCQHAHA